MTLLYLVRLDCQQRYEGLIEIFSYMARQCGLARFMTVWEVDERPYPMFSEYCKGLGIDYSFHEDHNKHFHRTQWSNKMVLAMDKSSDRKPNETQLIAGNVIAICHADVLVPGAQILQARDAILGGEKYVAAFEDEKGDLGLMRADTCYLQHLQAGGDIDAITVNDTMLDFPHKRRLGSYSGMVFLDRAFYISCGMDNENIIGWGPEEVERHIRMTGFGSGYRRIKGWAAHLPHPGAFSDSEQREKNAQECQRIHSLTPELRRAEVEKWRRERGY